MTEVATTVQPAEVELQATPSMNLIQMAVSKGADVDTIERLVAMYNEERREVARKAYHLALSNFQSEMPVIKRNKKGYDNNYKYAELDQLVSVAKPLLVKHGFSYTYKFRDLKKETGLIDRVTEMVEATRKFDIDKKKQSALETIIREIMSEKDIEVTIVVTHRDGHSEETTMVGPEDFSGFKNAIQSRGSSTSYLERYTFIGAFGLVTADGDNDGGKGKKVESGQPTSGKKPLTEDGFKKMCQETIRSGKYTVENVLPYNDLTEDQKKTLTMMHEQWAKKQPKTEK